MNRGPYKAARSALDVFREEAARRAQRLPLKQRISNKDLAKLSGLTPLYVAQVVARFRREIELRVDVSHETSTDGATLKAN